MQGRTSSLLPSQPTSRGPRATPFHPQVAVGTQWQCGLLDGRAGPGFDLQREQFLSSADVCVWHCYNSVSAGLSLGCFTQTSRFGRLLILLMSLLFSSLAGS